MEETQHVNASTFNQAAMNADSNMTDGHKSSPDTLAPKGYLPFVEARKFAHSLNLKTRKEWRNYVKGDMPGMPPMPANVPAHPDGIYKVKGWQGWKFWLGTADTGLGQGKQEAHH